MLLLYKWISQKVCKKLKKKTHISCDLCISRGWIMPKVLATETSQFSQRKENWGPREMTDNRSSLA